MTTTSLQGAIERLHRIGRWTTGYRALMRGGLHREIHTACTHEAKLPGGAFAYLDIEDVEWLLTIADAASASADEARDEMRKGAAAGFRADYPATAKLVDLFEDGEPDA